MLFTMIVTEINTNKKICEFDIVILFKKLA